MTSGTPPARKTWTVLKERGPFGDASTRRGTFRLTVVQSSIEGRFKPALNAMAGKCSRRFVDPPKGGMYGQRIADSTLAEDVAQANAALLEVHKRPRGVAGQFQPDFLSGGRERRVRQREAERFSDRLGRGGGPEELAPAARGSARAAAEFRRLLECDLTV
jgi:hypothetical protein